MFLLQAYCTPQKKKEKKKKENLLVGINRMIKELCLSDGCKYFDNDNIPRDMLYKVGLHLLDKGVSFLIKLQVWLLKLY